MHLGRDTNISTRGVFASKLINTQANMYFYITFINHCGDSRGFILIWNTENGGVIVSVRVTFLLLVLKFEILA